MYFRSQQNRLSQIRLRNVIRKLKTKLQRKEELAEGLHLIDFEQTKIENQTLNEKIEERNEELEKLSQKITSTVQVIIDRLVLSSIVTLRFKTVVELFANY